MRTDTGILTRNDVMTITNTDIWDEDINRCVTVSSLSTTLGPLGISYILSNDYAGSDNTYRLLPFNKIVFRTTPITGPTTYPFNIFFDTSSSSAMSSAIFSGEFVIYQSSTSAPSQSFSFSVNYQTGTSVNLSYQGSAISESVFNQLYFFITGRWSPSYICKCTIFKTKGTSFSAANNYKTTINLINSSSSSITVSTQGSPFKLSLIGTYNEFKQGLLGILIYLERTS